MNARLRPIYRPVRIFPNAEIRMQNQTCSMMKLECVGALPLLVMS